MKKRILANNKEQVFLETNRATHMTVLADDTEAEGRTNSVRFYKHSPERWALQVRSRRCGANRVHMCQANLDFEQITEIRDRLDRAINEELNRRGKENV